MKGSRRGVNGGEVGGWEKRRKGNCSPDVIYERRISFLKRLMPSYFFSALLAVKYMGKHIDKHFK